MHNDPEPAGSFCQLLTPAGPAAIAVVRLCGPRAREFLNRHVRSTSGALVHELRSGDVRRATFVDGVGDALDDALLTVHDDAPRFDIHLHLHGSPWLVSHCVALARDCGLPHIEHSPDTSNWNVRFGLGTLDAVAAALAPRMLTLRGVQWLLSQPARLRVLLGALVGRPLTPADRAALAAASERLEVLDFFTRPLRVALVGLPNVGKSTLINALADHPISIVSDMPGTTRDWVEAVTESHGFPIVWIDTAGMRTSADPIETAGIDRTRQLIAESDAVVEVIDASAPMDDLIRDRSSGLSTFRPVAIARNKSDLNPAQLHESRLLRPQSPLISVSALQRTGLNDLLTAVLTAVGRTEAALAEPAAFTPSVAQIVRDWSGDANRNLIEDKDLSVFDGDPNSRV